MNDDNGIFKKEVQDGKKTNNNKKDNNSTNNAEQGIGLDGIDLDFNKGVLSKEDEDEIRAEFAKKAAKEREKEDKEEKEKEDEKKEEQKLKEKREDKENKEKNDKEQEKKQENKDAVLRFLKETKDIMNGSSMIDAKHVGSLDGNEKDNKSAITKNTQNADRHEKTLIGGLYDDLQHNNVAGKGLDALKARQSNNTKSQKPDLNYTTDQYQGKNKQNAEKRKNENKQRDTRIKEQNAKRTADLEKKRQEAEKEIADERARKKAKRVKKFEEREQEYRNDLQKINDKYNKKIAKINDRSQEDAFSRLSEDGRQEIINTRSNSKEKEKLQNIHNDITEVEKLPDTLPKVVKKINNDNNKIKDPSELNINAQIDQKKRPTNGKKTDLKQQTTEAQAKFNAAIKKAEEQQQNTQLKPNNTNPLNAKNGGVKIS